MIRDGHGEKKEGKRERQEAVDRGRAKRTDEALLSSDRPTMQQQGMGKSRQGTEGAKAGVNRERNI